MKGIQGLLLSVGLGLAGAVCNWLYLERLAGKQERRSFIGIRSDAQINVGDPLREPQLVKVEIPLSSVGNLEQVAPPWSQVPAILGFTSSRSFRGGELVLYQDIRTPAAKDLNEKLGKNEVALWIPVDMRTFNSSRVNPDDEVSFVLPRLAGEIPATAERRPAPVTTSSEIVGPFRILEIGNRTGRPEIQRASGVRTAVDTSITIVAKLENGHLDAKSERITEFMRSTKSQGLQVILHPKNR